jgi:hypothetical protein
MCLSPSSIGFQALHQFKKEIERDANIQIRAYQHQIEESEKIVNEIQPALEEIAEEADE